MKVREFAFISGVLFEEGETFDTIAGSIRVAVFASFLTGHTLLGIFGKGEVRVTLCTAGVKTF